MNGQVVSIIVPIYNVDSYIDRCIRSVVAQSYQDWELLLVDDGSKDRSSTMCDAWAEKDDRIRVLHKENGGVSSARNLGIKEAKGDWLTFVDGDDLIAETFIEEMMQPVLENEDVTFVHAGCVNYYDNDRTEDNQRYEPYVGCDKSLLFQQFRGLAVSKLFRRDVVESNGIMFDERIKVAEDYIFTLEYLLHVDRYALSPSVGYYYYQREGSATKSGNREFDIGQIYGAQRKRALVERYVTLFAPGEESVDLRYEQCIRSYVETLVNVYACIGSRKERKRLVFEALGEEDREFVRKYSKNNRFKDILARGVCSNKTHAFFGLLLLIAVRLK